MAKLISVVFLILVFFGQSVYAMECVEYCQRNGFSNVSGNAYQWWDSAAAKGYARGQKPHVGAVLVWKQGSLPYGHVAVVSKLTDARNIKVNHANWSNPPDGEIRLDVVVTDTSTGNDWTAVKVAGGGTNPTYGFIYPQGMTEANPNCNHSSWKCSIRTNGPIGWFPPVDDCQQASQWYNMATVNGEKTVVGSTTKAACPQACYAN